jgi:hypothetical protein
MTEHKSEYRHVIETIQRHAGGGQVKMLKLTIFLDRQGRLMGKTCCDVIPLHPSNIWETLAKEIQ